MNNQEKIKKEIEKRKKFDLITFIAIIIEIILVIVIAPKSTIIATILTIIAIITIILHRKNNKILKQIIEDYIEIDRIKKAIEDER